MFRQRRKELMFDDENGFLCVYVGRISGEKRLDIIIDAVKNLKIKDNRKAFLAIIGDGPSAQKYAALHSKENRLYCRPKFLDHPELAEVSCFPYLYRTNALIAISLLLITVFVFSCLFFPFKDLFFK
jgi:glycosyltransferase involved in cell wall biosynthesis